MQKSQLVAMLRTAKVQHLIKEENGKSAVITRSHLFDGSLNYVETSYVFSGDGMLEAIAVENFGCEACCEGEECEDDAPLFTQRRS